MEPNNQTTIEGSKSHGALIGSIIIIVILIIGGVYLWNKSKRYLVILGRSEVHCAII